MPSFVQRAFQHGEWSPERVARADRSEYYGALRTCRNFLILRGGGLANRPGFRLVKDLAGAGRARLMRFINAPDQVYLLVVGGGGISIYRDGVQVAGVGAPWTSAEALEVRAAQSIGTMTFTHPNHAPRVLVRLSEESWTFNPVAFGPELPAPGGLAATEGAAGTLSRHYKVTAVASSLEESLASASVSVTTAAQPTEEAPHVVTWTPVGGAVEYNVYCDPYSNGTFGFIGTVPAASFRDIGQPPDFGLTPQLPRELFASSGNYPAVVGNHQQRRIFANTTVDPHAVFTSRVGFPQNFGISSPLQDDDGLAFRIYGTEAQPIEHILPLKTFVMMTSGGIWVVTGNQDGAITPSAIHADQVGYTGVSSVLPTIVGTTIFFVQARRRIIRDLRFDARVDGFDGRDLTGDATHLFDGYAIDAIHFQESPNSVLWAVRDDGTLLALTYVLGRTAGESLEYGWARHDTSEGFFEDVITIPEGNDDAVYVLVRREHGGAVRRTIERLASRVIRTLEADAFFVDSGVTVDGWNVDEDVTLRFNEIDGWTVDDLLEIEFDTGTLTSDNVGDALVLELRDPDGTVLESVTMRLEQFIDEATFRGHVNRDVPSVLQDGAFRASWGLARRRVENIAHLDGAIVSILADGNVVFNGDPNDEHAEDYRVSSGAVDLPTPAVVIHVGLPITADAETLDPDAPGSDLRDKRKAVKSVALLVTSSRGVWAGTDASALSEFQPLPVDGYNVAPPLVTGRLEVRVESSWKDHGRVFVRQRDPLPLAILAVMGHGGIEG